MLNGSRRSAARAPLLVFLTLTLAIALTLRRPDGRDEDREQFVYFLLQLVQPELRHQSRFDEQLEPIAGFVQLLRRTLDFADEFAVERARQASRYCAPTDVPLRSICRPMTLAASSPRTAQ
jgi:hypothetical protein